MIPIATDVWHVAAKPLKFPGGVRMPLASTVIRLADNRVVIYSPAQFDDADADAISALGDVAHIIAPSLLHHLYAGAAKERWPKATLHGAPGLAEKRKELTFGGDATTKLDDALDSVLIGAILSVSINTMLNF